MSRLTTIVILCWAAIVIGYMARDCDAHTIQVADLEVTASDKHEHWEKGNEADHHSSDHGESGKKGEEGYEKKNGYDLFIVLLSLIYVYLKLGFCVINQ